MALSRRIVSRQTSSGRSSQLAEGDETWSQNVRSLATRFSGTFPAMIAELIAPIEMPATQSGWYPCSAIAS
jgi:hypothetical protein